MKINGIILIVFTACTPMMYPQQKSWRETITSTLGSWLSDVSGYASGAKKHIVGTYNALESGISSEASSALDKIKKLVKSNPKTPPLKSKNLHETEKILNSLQTKAMTFQKEAERIFTPIAKTGVLPAGVTGGAAATALATGSIISSNVPPSTLAQGALAGTAYLLADTALEFIKKALAELKDKSATQEEANAIILQANLLVGIAQKGVIAARRV